tara:strand:+ start:545 stop:814 length:270 start_codon:yes stop_codon:yes gene_type:complete
VSNVFSASISTKIPIKLGVRGKQCRSFIKSLAKFFLGYCLSFLKGVYSYVGIVCCNWWLTLDKDLPFGLLVVVVAAVGDGVVVAVGLSN